MACGLEAFIFEMLHIVRRSTITNFEVRTFGALSFILLWKISSSMISRPPSDAIRLTAD